MVARFATVVVILLFATSSAVLAAPTYSARAQVYIANCATPAPSCYVILNTGLDSFALESNTVDAAPNGTPASVNQSNSAGFPVALGTASAVNSPVASATATAQAFDNGTAQTNSANLIYYWQILAPPSAPLGSYVPFTIAGNSLSQIQYFVTGPITFSEAFAELGVFYTSATGSKQVNLGVTCVTDQGSFPFPCNQTSSSVYSYTDSALVNSLVTMNMLAYVNAVGDTGASAQIDPFISIPQSYLDAGYSIDISPGIANATAALVPEAPTWAVMLAGLCVVATTTLAIRRKKVRLIQSDASSVR